MSRDQIIFFETARNAARRCTVYSQGQYNTRVEAIEAGEGKTTLKVLTINVRKM